MEQNSNYKMNSHLYRKLIYDKARVYNGEKTLQPMAVGRLDSYMQKIQTGLLYHTEQN